ncbi:glycerophosphodiester phosphodiesterase family protein [Vibrio fortis]|uniref:glycerophosphodiester phosphodiesterase family protein n=1 Tax=Vibrio fortis TaxID=212667 RepID=UPI004067701D
MNKLVNSISKRIDKILESRKIPVDVPLGKILEAVGKSQYGESYSVIAHGGGGTQYRRESAELYTNSKEAILDSIEDGKKLIELDLAVTSDGHIVAVHSWPEVKAKVAWKGINRQVLHDNVPLSYSEVKSIDLGKGIKPLCINEINDIFSEYQDLILVTDKIRDISLLSSQFKYLDRLIVEVFDLDSYELAFSLGISNIAYNVDIRKKNIVDWIENKRIKAVTFSAREVNLHPRAYENSLKLMSKGIVSLAYSSNDDDFIKNNIGVTISACYTDYWSLEDKSSILIGGNTTY